MKHDYFKEIFDVGYRWSSRRKFWSNVRQVWTNVKHMYRRARYGWTGTEYWNLDYRIAVLLARGAEDLANNMHGHPGDTTPEEWETYLRRLSSLWSLFAQADGSLDGPQPGSDEYNEAFDLLKARYYSLWD